MNSKIAESPEASETERCTVPGSPVGAMIGTTRNASLRSRLDRFGGWVSTGNIDSSQEPP